MVLTVYPLPFTVHSISTNESVETESWQQAIKITLLCGGFQTLIPADNIASSVQGISLPHVRYFKALFLYLLLNGVHPVVYRYILNVWKMAVTQQC
jgi:hypothetical protein